MREAESRGFHDEDVGRPAFGYEQFDGDAVRIEGGGSGVDRVLDEASSIRILLTGCVNLVMNSRNVTFELHVGGIQRDRRGRSGCGDSWGHREQGQGGQHSQGRVRSLPDIQVLRPTDSKRQKKSKQ